MSEMDVVLSKINIIKKCMMAIEKASQKEKDPDFQLSLFEINLQRAIQACIDLANIVLAKEGLGLPNSYQQSFELLAEGAVISSELASLLSKMVGFRNISVHDYGEVQPEIVRAIVAKHLTDFEKFYTLIYHRAQSWGDSSS